MVLSFATSVTNNNALDLVRLGHILGNNHYPLKIQDNKIYVRLVTNPKVLKKNIEQLNITGLEIGYTTELINYDSQDFVHHH